MKRFLSSHNHNILAINKKHENNITDERMDNTYGPSPCQQRYISGSGIVGTGCDSSCQRDSFRSICSGTSGFSGWSAERTPVTGPHKKLMTRL